LSRRFAAPVPRRWTQNISCPKSATTEGLQFLRTEKALKAEIFVQLVPVNTARTQLKFFQLPGVSREQVSDLGKPRKNSTICHPDAQIPAETQEAQK